MPFTIIGVLDKKGIGAAGRSQDDVVFVPISTAKSRVLGSVHGATRQALDFIAVKFSDAAARSAVENEIEALLRQRHHFRPDARSDFSIDNPADVLVARETAVRTWEFC
ncbi:ABC transporter permease [Bradyrhizobium sp. UFLA05-153]